MFNWLCIAFYNFLPYLRIMRILYSNVFMQFPFLLLSELVAQLVRHHHGTSQCQGWHLPDTLYQYYLPPTADISVPSTIQFISPLNGLWPIETGRATYKSKSIKSDRQSSIACCRQRIN